MAPLIQPFLCLLFVFFLLGLLSAPATARPCNTLFISFQPNFPDQNNPKSAGTAGILTIFSEIRQFNPHPLAFLAATEDPRPIERASRFGLGPVFDPDSLRDRTKGVLGVVLALLFGVGCGALTAATMYLGWSLFSNRHRFSDFDYDDFEDDDADMSPKKVGYVKIPPPPADVSLFGDVKIPPPPPPADVSPLGDVNILPTPPGDASSAGDVKIPLCPAYAPPGDAAVAGDVKIPPFPACGPPSDATPAGDVKIPPSPAYAPPCDVSSPAGDVKNPPSPAYAPPYDVSSPAGDVKNPPRSAPPADASPAGNAAPLHALPYNPISPSYSWSSCYSNLRRRVAETYPGVGYAPSYYYEEIRFTPVAKEAVQEEAQKN